MSRSRGGHVVDDLAGDHDFAAGDFLQPGDHPQGRGLAAAGRADQHDELPIGNIEIDRCLPHDTAS